MQNNYYPHPLKVGFLFVFGNPTSLRSVLISPPPFFGIVSYLSYMKYIITESQYNNAIDRFLTYQFEPHEEKTSKNNLDFIFWVKNGDVIAGIKNSKYFWVRDDIWRTISDMFSFDYNKTQLVIKYWLEDHYYYLGELTPVSRLYRI